MAAGALGVVEVTRRPHGPHISESRSTYLLLCAADETPRRAVELAAEANRLGASIAIRNQTTLVHRLAAQGSLARDPHRPAYTLTSRGEQHRRVLEIALPAQLARVLLYLTPEPQPYASLVLALGEKFRPRQPAIYRTAASQAFRYLEDLGLVARSGNLRARQVALTELGAATLPDAREVVMFVDGAA